MKNTTKLVAVFALCFNLVRAADFYVDAKNGNNTTGDGSKEKPWFTISFAMARVTGSGHTIHIAPGTYDTVMDGVFPEVFPLLVRSGISLVGAGADSTIIDAKSSNTVMRCENITVSQIKIEGFTIRNGRGTDVGGLALVNSKVLVQNNVFDRNVDEFTGLDGGAIHANGTITIQRNSFTNNQSGGSGGAIAVGGGTVTIAENEFIGNSAGFSGGAFYMRFGSNLNVAILDNVFLSNRSFNPEDMFIGAGSPLIARNLITSVVNCLNSKPILLNNTFVGSSSENAIRLENASPTIINNIIAGWSNGILEVNATSDPDTVAFNLFFNNACLYYDENIRCFNSLTTLEPLLPEVAHNLVGNPQFVDAGNNDYHLLLGSPAIDAGDPNSPLDPDSTRADVGAFYFHQDSTLSPPILLSPVDGATNQPFTPTLSWNASPGASSYRLQVSTSNTFASLFFDDSTLTTTSQQVGPLANNTNYFWRVKAKAGSVQSTWSSIFRFTTMGAPPAAPQNLRATASDGQVTLTWDAKTESDFLRYRIYGGTAPNPTTKIDSVEGVSNTTKTISGLTNGTRYYFRITAVNNALVESGFSNEASATPAQELFTDIGALLEGVRFSSVTWGDYDNDGDLDVALTGRDGSGREISRIYKNTNGSFADISANLTGVRLGSAGWGDYDNDGDLDILLTGEYAAQNTSKLYRNEEGNFVETSTALSGVRNSSTAWGDYDNDGDLDILLTGLTGIPPENISKLYSNDEGSFREVPAPFTPVNFGSVAWGDYDNDGDLDALLTGSAISKVYKNNHGSFAEFAALQRIFSSSVAWGDYDGDGDLDILLAGNEGSNDNPIPVTKVYRNNEESFANISASLIGVYSGAVAWGDYDNDGDLDILLTGWTGSIAISKVYRNDAGSFVESNALLIGVQTSSAAWGDFDNDSDLDILLTGLSDSGPVAKIYRNNIRTQNSVPSKPMNLVSSVQADSVGFAWNKSSDTQTPQNTLTYNLRLGTTPGGAEIVSPMADTSTGFRKLPQLGNANHNTNWTINNLEPGYYYWSVQAIDNAFAGSDFAAEQSFEIKELLVTPETIDFGEVTIGDTAFKTLEVKNLGDTLLHVMGMFIVGPGSTVFDLNDKSGFDLNPGESRKIEVSFFPSSAVRVQAVLVIQKTDYIYHANISLFGTGVSRAVPVFQLSTNAIDFGQVQVSSSREDTLTIFNPGSATLSIASVSLSGANADEFTLISPASFVIPQDDSAEVIVRFNPTSIGTKVATLTFAHNASGSPSTVSLFGNAVTQPVPSIQLSTTSLVFNAVLVGSAKVDTLRLSNPGTANLEVTGITISGAQAAEFSVLSATSFSVAPNQSAETWIRFNPTSSGDKTASLAISHNASGSPSTVALTGTGVTRAIAVQPDSLAFSATNLGEFSDKTLTIFNAGAIEVAVHRIALTGIDAVAFALIDASSFTLPPQQQRDIIIRLRPARLGNLSSDLKIFHNAPGDSLVVRLSGTGVDFIPPTISNVNAAATVELGNPVLVTALVSDNYLLDKVNLQYRQGGQSIPIQLRMDSTEAGYSATIPGEVATARGVEFNLEALDLAQNKSAERAWQSIRVRLPDKHLSFAQRGSSRPPAQSDYRLISFPLDSDDPSIATSLLDDLGPADTLKWRLWDIDPQRSASLFPYREYPNVGNLASGKAKFLITRENKTLTSGTGLTVATTTPFQILLQPGWNMIASPFNFDIPVQNVQPESLRQHLYAFDGTWQSQPSHLRSWTGYMIKAKELFVLSIQPSETAQGLIAKTIATPDWLIRMEAESENARDVDNFVGVITDADEAWDRYERFEPPPIGAFVMLAFPQHEWQRYPDIYTTDFRPAATEGHVWSFTLTTHMPGKAATLRFENLDSVPAELEIRLFDIVLNLIQDVRRTREYVCRTNASATKSFLLLVGRKEFIAEHSAGLTELPSRFELAQNFPNPFSPPGPGTFGNPSTAIKIGMPQKARVTLKIYDLLGKELATLWDEVEKEAGYHVAIWEGKDQQGNFVPSGIYLYRLQVGQQVWVKKMTLLK